MAKSGDPFGLNDFSEDEAKLTASYNKMLSGEQQRGDTMKSYLSQRAARPPTQAPMATASVSTPSPATTPRPVASERRGVLRQLVQSILGGAK